MNRMVRFRLGISDFRRPKWRASGLPIIIAKRSSSQVRRWADFRKSFAIRRLWHLPGGQKAQVEFLEVPPLKVIGVTKLTKARPICHYVQIVYQSINMFGDGVLGGLGCVEGFGGSLAGASG